MVASSRATVRPDRLRPLNTPRPIRVEEDERGWPIRVKSEEFRVKSGPSRNFFTHNSLLPPGGGVLQILDRWRIDDEWWRKEISRMYFQVVLEGGRILVLFHDLIEGGWFLQTVATPLAAASELPEVLVPRVTPVAAGKEVAQRAG